MGLDINAVQFLMAAHKKGVQLGEVLTLGRQDLNVFPTKMRRLLKAQGLPDELFAPGARDTTFAEPVFKALGAKAVYSLDVSTFEGASFVQDLSKPIPSDLRERFDLVYDGGTLEHVFNFPVALQNCMEMLRPGGRLFIHTVANNYCGHGFYQFSPELFYRALCPGNGYEVERMVLHAMGPYGRWYEVSDPESVRARVELISLFPVQLLIQARRIRAIPVFATPPQQSDFVPRWDHQANPGVPQPATTPGPKYGAPRSQLAKVFPGLARLLNGVRIGFGLLCTHSITNRKSFRRVKRGN
jgi:SAM-dependent methyltransferase